MRACDPGVPARSAPGAGVPSTRIVPRGFRTSPTRGGRCRTTRSQPQARSPGSSRSRTSPLGSLVRSWHPGSRAEGTRPGSRRGASTASGRSRPPSAHGGRRRGATWPAAARPSRIGECGNRGDRHGTRTAIGITPQGLRILCRHLGFGHRPAVSLAPEPAVEPAVHGLAHRPVIVVARLDRPPGGWHPPGRAAGIARSRRPRSWPLP